MALDNPTVLTQLADPLVQLMAGPDVPIDQRAVDKALDLIDNPEIRPHAQAMLLTPDLHRGSGIPVGAVLDLKHRVVPSVIGRDIGCGMRLLVLEGVKEADIAKNLPAIGQQLRHIFFEGGRQIQTSPGLRQSMLEHGLVGLDDQLGPQAARQGLWARSRAGDMDRNVYRQGGFSADQVYAGFGGYVAGSGSSSAESQLGSLGGGNHFCEVSVVQAVTEGPTAYSWGLEPGSVTVMVHSGSLALGSAVAADFAHQKGGRRDQAAVLQDQLLQQYWNAMSNAMNFAWANRLCMGLMAEMAVEQALGGQRRISHQVVYDSPHNFVESVDGIYRHRKGATPAPGANAAFDSGTPVLLPGSMGDLSWVLAGTGQESTLQSGPHGAGRQLSRGQAGRTPDAQLQQLEVVGPIDARKLVAAGRSDLLKEQQRRLQEEAPGAYKSVGPVVQSLVDAGGARKVACLRPLLTVKG